MQSSNHDQELSDLNVYPKKRNFIFCFRWQVYLPKPVSETPSKVLASDIKSLDETGGTRLRTEIITKNGDSYVSGLTIDEIMDLLDDPSHVTIYDCRVDNFVSYEDFKGPPNKEKQMTYIMGSSKNCQGHVGGHYALPARSVALITPCNTGRFKSEVLPIKSGWGMFTEMTIHELVKMQGMNPDVRVYEPITKTRFTYQEWCERYPNL